MASDREMYFVVAVDLDGKTVRIDDDTFAARFAKWEQVWLTDTQEWREHTEQEYDDAVALLNERKLERE